MQVAAASPTLSRRAAIRAIGAGILGAAFLSHSAPPPGTRRLGIFYFRSPTDTEPWSGATNALKELAKLGWVEGRNLVLVPRYAQAPEEIAPRAADLVRSGVDAIFTEGTTQTRALQQATKTIPIVTGVGDPIRRGFALSLARPGGNVTGVSFAMDDIALKQLDLLRAVVPNLSRVDVAMDGENPGSRELAAPMQAAAKELGISSEFVPILSLSDIHRAFHATRGAGARAVFIYSPFNELIEMRAMAELAIRNAVPTMSAFVDYVVAGGLMSFSLSFDNQAQRSASQLDKVLRGMNPAEIPFELPGRSELALNRLTAKALKLAIPERLLLSATRVVE